MRLQTNEWHILALGLGIAALSSAVPEIAHAARPHGAVQSVKSTRATEHAAGEHVASEHGAGTRGATGSHAAGTARMASIPKVFHPSETTGGSKHLVLSMHAGHVILNDGVYYHGGAKFANSKFPNGKFLNSKTGKARYAMHFRGAHYATAYGYGDGGYSSLQCVPFARAASGIDLKGNAVAWWDAAAGIYERGNQPEPGSVLTFRATGNMRLGHVAVVTGIDSAREIEVDHANWAGAGAYKGGIARGVHVIDVSAANDWTEVRVALPGGGDFGSVYPTHGFIYDRPDTGMMEASTRVRYNRGGGEVAEAPPAR